MGKPAQGRRSHSSALRTTHLCFQLLLNPRTMLASSPGLSGWRCKAARIVVVVCWAGSESAPPAADCFSVGCLLHLPLDPCLYSLCAPCRDLFAALNDRIKRDTDAGDDQAEYSVFCSFLQVRLFVRVCVRLAGPIATTRPQRTP